LSRAPIGVADVLRAVALLAPEQPARWPAIAAALGFELPKTGPDGPRRPEEEESEERAGVEPMRPRVAVGGGVARQESSLPVLAPLEGRAQTPQPFLVGVTTLPREAETATAPVPPLRPLLAPATAPSILRATVVMPEPRGPLDLGAIVPALARRRLPARLPRRRRLAMAHDVVVMQDLGEGMDVFSEDAEAFVESLRQAAGRDAVRVGGFVGRPAEALAEVGMHRGTAVVVLTDLGLSPLAGPDEQGSARWLELAGLTRRAGARATLLVPWPERRWPPEIAARLALATWDRSTSVAQVMRAVREHG